MKSALIPLLLFALACGGGGGNSGAANEVDGVTQDRSGRRVVSWIDPMYAMGPPHNYKSNHPGIAPDCNMKLTPLYADETSPAAGASQPAGRASVSMPAGAQQLLGVKLATVEERSLSRTIRATGRVTVDERRIAQVRTKFEGFVDALYVNVTGQPVRRGDPLLSIYSPDLLATQNELILAERNHSDLGRTLADAARARLRLFDMSAADIDRVTSSGKAQRDVTLHSPASGVVVTKNVVAGARVMPSDTLYEIADLSHVWLLADVYESDLPSIRLGMPAQVVAGGRTRAGRVTFIGPVVTAQTRTASVRVELDNRDALLKPEMYADVLLESGSGTALSIPDTAVLNTGTRAIVYVATPNGAYDPREVQLGEKANGYYAIRSGLTAGDKVVVDANFLVDSESRLRAAAR